MSGSGIRSIQENTQERAVSVDINRLQAFLGAGVAELFRQLLDTSANEDLEAGAVATLYTTTTSPLRAEVLEGLLVHPVAGTLDLTVDPGTLYGIVTASSSDDSPYRFCSDVGIPLAGTIVMTANASGSPRVDVIECSFNATDAIVTDNRDIFDATTGLFTPTTVTKERKSQLTYRVRAGTPGSGFPGTASGWLPIAVALIPTGSTTNDNIVFWDVRPLINDRIFNVSNLAMSRPRAWGQKTIFNAATLATASGIFEAHLNGRRIGGRLRSGNDGTTSTLTADAQTIDLTNAINRENGFATIANQLWYLYVCTPYGLPRWARYTTGPSSRVPRSPRGIPIMSTVAPDADGKPSSAVPMPASWGTTTAVQTTEAVCVFSGYADSGNVMRGGFGDENGVTVYSPMTDVRTFTNPVVVAPTEALAPGGIYTATFTLTAGTHYPPNARWIQLQFGHVVIAASNNSTNPGNVTLATYLPNAGALFSEQAIQVFGPGDYTSAGIQGNIEIGFTVWVPVPSVYPSTTAPTQKFVVSAENSGFMNHIITASAARVIGYRL